MAKKPKVNEKKQQAMWLKELKENKAIQEYLSQYSEDSVQSFIEFYLSRKKMWYQYGSLYKEAMETDGIKWLEEAFIHLKIILQKKLFDLQCKWRAEQITIEGVELCAHFDFWERDILNCPFIEPISFEEKELYVHFLLDSNYEIDDERTYYFQWQDYEKMMDAYNENDDAEFDFPEWYAYTILRTNVGGLLLLPDIRGEKEEFYMDIARKAWQEEMSAKQAANTEPASEPSKPSYHYFTKENLAMFVNTFESEESKEAFTTYEWGGKDDDKRQELEEELDLLFSVEEPVPIEANGNWMEAVKLAASTYKRKKIAAAMSEAWEQYRMNIEMGIGYPKDKKDAWLVNYQKKEILKGRVLNGEPKNLDF